VAAEKASCSAKSVTQVDGVEHRGSEMLKTLLSTVACASVLTIAVPSDAVMTPAGTLTAARALTAVRTPTGYTLSGELQSLNTCMDVHFVANRMIDGYDALQYKRPGSGPICGMVVT